MLVDVFYGAMMFNVSYPGSCIIFRLHSDLGTVIATTSTDKDDSGFREKGLGLLARAQQCLHYGV